MQTQTQSQSRPKPHTKPARTSKRSLAAESAPHRPARPLLGVLPVARVVPMNVHSVMDYASGALGVSALFMADTARAKIAGAALGGTAIVASLLTDYELSLAKLIPIELHEVIDYVNGFSLIAAPFVLGYVKKDPLVSILQIATGASVILSSLLTDYRAAEGVGAELGVLLEDPSAA